MRDRRGQLDMAHALAPDLGQRDLDAALLADDAVILHALVLAAQALVVLDRTEDAGAEQAVPLRLERAVVDRLRLLDLAERPGADPLRARDRDRIWSKVCGLVGWPKMFINSFIRLPARSSPIGGLGGSARSCSGGRISQSDAGSIAALLQLDVEAERTQFLHQHVEGFRNAGLEVVVAADDAS